MQCIKDLDSWYLSMNVELYKEVTIFTHSSKCIYFDTIALLFQNGYKNI